MRKGWRILVVGALVVVLGAHTIQAAVAGGSKGIHLSGWVGDVSFKHQDTAANRYFGTGLTGVKNAVPQLDLDLSTSAMNENKVSASGSGQIRIANATYPLTLKSGQTLDVAQTADGEVYVGGVQATLTTKSGEIPATMVVLYQPTHKKAMVNVAIGDLGNEVLIGFGRPFMTREQMEALGPKTAQ